MEKARVRRKIRLGKLDLILKGESSLDAGGAEWIDAPRRTIPIWRQLSQSQAATRIQSHDGTAAPNRRPPKFILRNLSFLPSKTPFLPGFSSQNCLKGAPTLTTPSFFLFVPPAVPPIHDPGPFLTNSWPSWFSFAVATDHRSIQQPIKQT